MVAVLILYLVIQNLEAYVITPTIMANQVSLLPAMTLAAQLIFARFFGFLGLLLALPLAVIAKTFIQEILIKDILDQWRGTNQRTITERRIPEDLPPNADSGTNPFSLPPETDLYHDREHD